MKCYLPIARSVYRWQRPLVLTVIGSLAFYYLNVFLHHGSRAEDHQKTRLATTRSRDGFITLATDQEYAEAALVLLQSLIDVNSSRGLTMLIHPNSSISARLTTRMKEKGANIVEVDTLPFPFGHTLRERWKVAFSKLRIWSLDVSFDKLIWIDADALVLQNIDHLFGLEELAAAQDYNVWDCVKRDGRFCSGTMVLRPSQQTFNDLVGFVDRVPSDLKQNLTNDQDVLNYFFNKDGRKATLLDQSYSAFVDRCTCNNGLQFDQVKVAQFITKPWKFRSSHIACMRPFHHAWRTTYERATGTKWSNKERFE